MQPYSMLKERQNRRSISIVEGKQKGTYKTEYPENNVTRYIKDLENFNKVTSNDAKVIRGRNVVRRVKHNSTKKN